MGLVVLLGGSATADAGPRRTLIAQHRPKAPKKVVTPRAVVVDAAMAAPAPTPTANAVMVHYQRIGRDLMQLQNFRGTECTLDLWPQFRAIKLETALATPDTRREATATLTELQVRIERKRGITIRQECLDNPLTTDCQ